jgi:hypothetical protein
VTSYERMFAWDFDAAVSCRARRTACPPMGGRNWPIVRPPVGATHVTNARRPRRAARVSSRRCSSSDRALGARCRCLSGVAGP